MANFSDLTIRTYKPQPLIYKGRFVKNWFSNFERDGHPITYRGHTTDCLEVAFVASKNPTPEFIDLVFKAGPGEAKRLGRNTQLRADWDEVNIAAMDFFLRQKWQPGTNIANRLMETEQPIVEFSNWGDDRWGCTLGKHEGRNALGLLLEIIKAELLNGTLQPGAEEANWATRQDELVAIMNSMVHGIHEEPKVQLNLF
jgi:predicted NAD-dependent protein-ADP-ribosyltransferase YbiA (DUF1768 family)